MGLMTNVRMLAAAAVVAVVSAGSALALPYSLVKVYDPGNDCSGVFGQGFENCESPDGSPIIAKYDVGNAQPWTLNTSVFPGLVNSMFTMTFTDGKSGTWSYNGTTGVKITSFVLKAGSAFAYYKMNTPSASFSNIAWSTSDLGNKNLSHFSAYDTVAPVPLPASGILMLGVIGGIAALRRRMAA
jgi:hypothetical protein